MRIHKPLLLAGLSLIVACQSQPPIVVDGQVDAAPELASENPNEVALLEVEDATEKRSITPHLKDLRKNLGIQLARLGHYATMDFNHVDTGVGPAVGSAGSITEASYLGSMTGRVERAEALLGVRIDEWDTSSIMQDGRVKFAAAVCMVSAKSRARLWSGRLSGSVKAGGSGPAPLTRAAREEDAVERMAQAIMSKLPQREQ